MNEPDRLPLCGIVEGLPAALYHAQEGVSNSMLSAMRRSPAHCYALHLAPDRPPQQPPTAAQSAGTLAHCAILEGDALAERFIARPAGMDFRTKDGKAWRDAQTLEIIDADMLATATSQRAAVLAVPELANALASGRAETSVFWTDERTGLRCRCRPDWLHTLPDGRVIVLDLKTAGDVSPAEFARSVWTWGYHRQAAHYSAGLAAVGIEVAAFLFAAVTSAYPFIAVPYLLDDDACMRGAAEVRDLLDLYATCRASGEWPAYGAGVQVLTLPAWAK